MTPESIVADEYIESYGSKKGKYGPRGGVNAIIVHTTGAGPVRRHKADPKKFPTPFDAAVWIYTKIYAPGPHYVVGQNGECVQVCKEELAAWHVGSSQAAQYKNPKGQWTKTCKWWLDRWEPAGFKSPLELPCWGPVPDNSPASVKRLARAGTVNAWTIGIEVVPPLNTNDPWSASAQNTLWDLVDDIAARHSLPVDRTHVLTHSDAHPLHRTNGRGRPWDPPESQWHPDVMPFSA